MATFLFALAGCGAPVPDTSPGVSRALAEHRARTISDVRYELRFSVPASPDEPVRGSGTIRFRRSNARAPLVLDFAGPAERGLSVRVGGEPVEHEVVGGHIVVPASALGRGGNAIELEWIAGDDALNRTPSFLYTLFVPDRASTAFPGFDQPDLKARFTLELEVPAAWAAVANGEALDIETAADRAVHRFAETEPLSTYVFAFAAGEFEVETAERGGRVFRMLHRETDAERVARNRDAIFELHAASLAWLEEYTAEPYAFGKFDFVLVPDFQFGGMEHPGAILYRASSLLLEETATQAQELGRARLIAHETAHMWFGNLVTMKWFDDVWTKEVFANFMAAKIVDPSFPELDHELRFLLAHHPAAYAVDRSPGANPVRQPLDNMAEAADLYGPIIYNKAPVVMRQLERLVGEDAFRDGIREYIARHRFANATWPDLIAILDARTGEDLREWSRIWIEEPGRPTVSARVEPDGNGRVAALVLEQSDPAGGGRVWNQWVDVELGYADGPVVLPAQLTGRRVTVREADGLPVPGYVLPDARGAGYARWRLDAGSRARLLAGLGGLPEPTARGAALLALWDAVLEAEVPPGAFLVALAGLLETERDEQLADHALGYLSTTYWRLLSDDERRTRAPALEALLLRRIERSASRSMKAAYLNAYRSIALTPDGVDRLHRLWRQVDTIPGLPLSESDYTMLAFELAVRRSEGTAGILEEQRQRLTDPDRRARFEFVMPAVSPDGAERAAFFASLRDPRNRQREPWVLEALSHLNHPLRAAESEAFLRPALELLEAVHRTGAIFFPARWLGATLGGHSSPRAAAVVREFLESRPDYPPRLRAQVLQAADMLFRAAAILGEEAAGGPDSNGATDAWSGKRGE